MHDDKFSKGSRGEFRGDFTRDTFDPLRNFSRVLMQQGRVQLDADWNEQVSILLHYMRQLGKDLMGPHGAPYPDDYKESPLNDFENFKIKPYSKQDSQPDFSIAPGRYYVDGICCENEKKEDGKEFTFRNQHNELFIDEELKNGQDYLVYLDVWERHLSYVEDDYIREKALGGADTATRAQIVWQVKVMHGEDFKKVNVSLDKLKKIANGPDLPYSLFLRALTAAKKTNPGTGQLKARAKKASEDDNKPCLTAPEASYRGAENQLYRVEIHNGSVDEDGPTFKWSRENGSVIFPIFDISGDTITLEHLGRDDRFGLQPGDWVEVLDDDVILRNEANPLLKVTAIDRESLQVTLTLNGDAATTELLAKIGANLIKKHPYLRRWDQKKGVNKEGVVPVIEGYGENDWIVLEDGVEIQFYKILNEKIAAAIEAAGREAVEREVVGREAVAREREMAVAVARGIVAEDLNSNHSVYQTGDYWLIPARTATEDVEWPQDENGNPIALSPQGVEHHYAPLAIITVNDDVVVDDPTDLRRQLQKGWV